VPGGQFNILNFFGSKFVLLFLRTKFENVLKTYLQIFGAVTMTIFYNSPPEMSSHHHSRC